MCYKFIIPLQSKLEKVSCIEKVNIVARIATDDFFLPNYSIKIKLVNLGTTIWACGKIAFVL